MKRLGRASDLAARTGLLVLGVAFAMATAAADWQEIARSDDGNRYSLDPRSVIRDRDTVSALVRNEYATPTRDDESGKTIFAALDRLVVNCGLGSFALQSRAYVAADGSEFTVLAASRDELKLRPVVAGSLSETIVRAICKAAGGGG
jgi:hypothetical protein